MGLDKKIRADEENRTPNPMFTKHELYRIELRQHLVTIASGLSPFWPGVTTGIVSDYMLLSRFTRSTQIIWPKAASASGSEESRTPALSRARGTFSQLNYRPLVEMKRIELSTFGLQGRCSPVELHSRNQLCWSGR